MTRDEGYLSIVSEWIDTNTVCALDYEPESSKPIIIKEIVENLNGE